MKALAAAAAKLMRPNPAASKTARFSAVVKASPDGILEFTGSTAAPDRAGDIVEQNWDLDGYRQNPVVLYGHDHEGLPVGKAVKVGVKRGDDGQKALTFRVKFVPREVYPFAGLVQDLYAGGFLKAFSVGFRPLETKLYSNAAQRPDGLGPYGQHITRSELLEVSAVPVPANASALVSAGAGARIAPIYKARGVDAALVTKGLKVAEAKAWLEAKNMEVNEAPAEDAPVATEELDAQGHCDAALALLEADGGVTDDALKEAIEHLKALKAGMMPEEHPEDEEEPEGEEPEPEDDEDEDEDGEDDEAPPPPKSYAALEARIAALEKTKSGDSSDECEDEVEAALAGDLELPGLVALEGALGLDDGDDES